MLEDREGIPANDQQWMFNDEFMDNQLVVGTRREDEPNRPWFQGESECEGVDVVLDKSWDYELVLAMGTNERLGANSFFNLLNADCLVQICIELGSLDLVRHRDSRRMNVPHDAPAGNRNSDGDRGDNKLGAAARECTSEQEAASAASLPAPKPLSATLLPSFAAPGNNAAQYACNSDDDCSGSDKTEVAELDAEDAADLSPLLPSLSHPLRSFGLDDGGDVDDAYDEEEQMSNGGNFSASGCPSSAASPAKENGGQQNAPSDAPAGSRKVAENFGGNEFEKATRTSAAAAEDAAVKAAESAAAAAASSATNTSHSDQVCLRLLKMLLSVVFVSITVDLVGIG